MINPLQRADWYRHVFFMIGPEELSLVFPVDLAVARCGI